MRTVSERTMKRLARLAQVCLLLSVPAAAPAQEVFVTRGAGSPMYSDQPQAGAKPVLLPELNISKPVPVPKAAAPAASRVSRESDQPAAAAGFPPEEDVLRHGQLGDQVEFLVNHPDAQRLGLPRRAQVDFLAEQAQLARGASAGAAEDLGQRGFPRPVLAQQDVHLAAPQGEIDPRQCRHPGVRLTHLPQFENDVVRLQ